MGIRSIGRLMGIHSSLVCRWIKKAGKIIKNKIEKATKDILKKSDGEIIKKENIDILEIDEMVTYVKKKLKMEENMFLFGLLLFEGKAEKKETKAELLILK